MNMPKFYLHPICTKQSSPCLSSSAIPVSRVTLATTLPCTSIFAGNWSTCTDCTPLIHAVTPWLVKPDEAALMIWAFGCLHRYHDLCSCPSVTILASAAYPPGALLWHTQCMLRSYHVTCAVRAGVEVNLPLNTVSPPCRLCCLPDRYTSKVYAVFSPPPMSTLSS